ncbi:MAG: hypothetical protein RLZZ618_1130 [Pseudomonadota bacterium]
MIPASLTPDTSGDAPPSPALRWVLISLSLSTLLSSLGTSIANVGLPTFAQVFGASFQEVQWIVLAYLLAITTLIVGAGRLGDLVGRRRLLLVGIGVFTVASALCGVAPSLGALVAARAVQGVGAALMMALTLSMVGETVPKNRTGQAMGLLGTLSAIGTALGPSLGGLLIAGPGWRALFFVLVPLGTATWMLARRHLPVDRVRAPSARTGFDPLGTLLLALSLAAYALAMTLGRGQFGALNAGLLLVAAIGAGAFVWVESRVASPLIRLAMFSDRTLSASLGMSALVTTVMMATLVVGPFYLAGALGLETAVVGLVMSAGPLVTALASAPAGRLADRVGASRLTLIGLGCTCTGASLLALMPTAWGVAGYLGAIVITTGGYALFQTANNTTVMGDVAAEQRGVVSGLLGLSRNLGLMTGASVMGAVFAWAANSTHLVTAPRDAVAFGMRTTFAIGVVLIGVALVIGVWAGGRGRRVAASA